MDDIKQKLEQYRAKKRLEIQANSNQQKPTLSTFERQTSASVSVNSSSNNVINKSSSPDISEPAVTNEEEETAQPFLQKLSNFLVKLIIWLGFYAVALQFQFGIVYIIATGFYLLWISLSTRKRRADGELSAYSVFNPNCERLLGTLTAEQFENEILRRQPM